MRIPFMKQQFFKPVLVCNDQSGSHDAAIETEIAELLQQENVPLLCSYRLPKDQVPSAEQLIADGADLLIVWTGDGTINAAAHINPKWNGALLALPGGTLNLLSKSIHGDRDPMSILRDAIGPKAQRRKIPTLRYEGPEKQHDALITILAGPATRWAEVRETMRQDGLISATEEAPEALDEMINGDGVHLLGEAEEYPAIILTPTSHAIEAHGIIADSTLDIIRHGLAWMKGDFRDGPSIKLTNSQEIILESRVAIRVEFDGELAEVSSPARFTLSESNIDFVTTL